MFALVGSEEAWLYV